MLYQAIRLGSTIYHCDSSLSRSSEKYRKLLCCELDHTKWQNPLKLDQAEVEKVREFVAGTWKTRNMQTKTEHLLPVLKKILPKLNKLRGRSILNVCLDEKIDGERTADLICRSFKKLANCSNNQNEATATSKILHIIYPDLFLMWDRAIRCGYGGYDWIWYTDFLRRMQMLAKFAIKQVRENEPHYSDETAIASLTGCKRTLAKTLDEYNYMKFTRNCDAVWKAEYESCNSP